ncbi:MAG: serine/threonine-protein kinase [Jatrophihabitans sp.]|uniref:serine/threonine-protein kinase n=1 Tax=Jatrophihabitans sp. TaxID=1932789 RepID=UPI003F81DB14
MRRGLGRPGRGASSDRFPGFADVAEIGVGVLATVYRAREVDTNRFVALKLLNVRDASPRALESFERESIALGAISSHPNIVTLYRSFRAADGRPVLVLELCMGSVAQRVGNGSGMPAPDAVAIGIKIAGALETAHRAGILHRDVKPQNILITEFGEPALADFGVAMLQSSTQTTAGLFDFTTLHAAPELLEGGETSAATDVYELASTLYQLIAGRSAFRAYEGESPASVILRILRDPVQPLVGAGVPMALSDLLIQAMSKEMDARPRTAAEFAAELAAVEQAQGWPRTSFLLRDAPRPPQEPVVLVPPRAAEPAAGPAVEPAVETLVRPTTVVYEPHQGSGESVTDRWAPPPTDWVPEAWEPPAPPAAPEPPAPPASSAPEPKVEPATDLPELEHDVELSTDVEERSVVDDAPAGQVTAPPAVFPVAPTLPPVEAPPPPAVPVWNARATEPAPAPAPVPAGDERRLSIRAGLSSLTAEPTVLRIRSGWRRTDLPWREIDGFEPQFARNGQSPHERAYLVALTSRGRVPLRATRRPAAELQRLHGILDDYRRRGGGRR